MCGEIKSIFDLPLLHLTSKSPELSQIWGKCRLETRQTDCVWACAMAKYWRSHNRRFGTLLDCVVRWLFTPPPRDAVARPAQLRAPQRTLPPRRPLGGAQR